jgi:hypothetical protein
MNPLQILNFFAQPREKPEHEKQLERVCERVETVIKNHEGFCDLSAALEMHSVRNTAPRGTERAGKPHKAELFRVLLCLIGLESRAFEQGRCDPEMAAVIEYGRQQAIEACTLYLRSLDGRSIW